MVDLLIVGLFIGMIIGFFFHFGQSLFKNLCLHGMKSQYGQDVKLRTWLKSLVSLALVPTKNVQDEFVDLLEQMQGTLLKYKVFRRNLYEQKKRL